MRVTERDFGRASAGGFGAGRLARGFRSCASGLSISAARLNQNALRSVISLKAARLASLLPRRRFTKRLSHRDGMVADSASRLARVSQTSCAPSACWKSCAARPMRRSGRRNPASARMARLSHGSAPLELGQTPSFRPASIKRSAPCTRASIGPQINRSACGRTGLRKRASLRMPEKRSR